MTRLPRPRRAPLALGAAIALTAILLPAVPAAAEPVGVRAERPSRTDAGDRRLPRLDLQQPVIDSETEETAPIPHHRVMDISKARIFSSPSISTRRRKRRNGTDASSNSPTRSCSPGSPPPPRWRMTGPWVRALQRWVRGAGGNSFVSLGYRHAAAAAKFAETVADDTTAPTGPSSATSTGRVAARSRRSGPPRTPLGVAGICSVGSGGTPADLATVPRRAAAQLILGDKADQIRDALMPGGSGDPYATSTRRSAPCSRSCIRSASPGRAGSTPITCWAYGGFSVPVVSDTPLDYDPTYVDDFWNADGYLGTEDSPLGDECAPNLPRWATPWGTGGISRNALCIGISCPLGRGMDRVRPVPEPGRYTDLSAARRTPPPACASARVREYRFRRLDQRQDHCGPQALRHPTPCHCTPTGTATA